MTKLLVNICRMVLALTFVLSGFVKAVDPLGTQYKIEDYAAAMGTALPPLATLAAAVMLATVEFSLGLFMLFAIRRRLTSRAMLAIMLVMTPLTLWLWIANPISDCGCFGDAIVLTNGQTLAKNIVLLAAAAVVAWKPGEMFRFVSEPVQWIVINYTVLFILSIAGWSLYDLPQFDFRPYHIGATLRSETQRQEGTDGQAQYVFIYEKNGKQQEFTIDNLPDSTWTFVRRMETQPAKPMPLTDLAIDDDMGNDITQEVINDTSYTFLLVSPKLEKADDSRFDILNEIYEYSVDHGYRFLCLTASDSTGRQMWREMTGAEYPICFSDETTLKTVIRSNPGLVLIHDGTVTGKWSHNRLPHITQQEAAKSIPQLHIGQDRQDAAAMKVIKHILWFVLPLMILVVADRTWMWTRWVRRKKVQTQEAQAQQDSTDSTAEKE